MSLEKLRISVSRLNSFGFCPKAHDYTYNQNLEPKAAALALDVGKLVHSTIEEFYQTGVMPIISDDLGEVGAKARSATQTYSLLAKMQDNFKVVDVEKEFEVNLEDINATFVGVIDAVIEIDGQLWLMEHKTCSQHWSNERVGMSNQHVLYEIVAQELYGKPVAGTIYNFLRITTRAGQFHTDAKRTFVPADEHARQAAYDDMANRVAAIRTGYNSRNAGQQCAYCSMFRLCQSDYLGGDTQYLIDEYYKPRKKR